MDNVLVRLENVSKRYKDKFIIKNLSLDIYEGEFLTLLGSSGCGKTTIIRMISGLENVTEGKVYIDSKDVTNLEPTKRAVNTVFQNLALFPHMTVEENISFGLKMKKTSKEEIDKQVKKVIKLVKLEGFEKRYPKELSGGQQQRVAIARGIVMNPKVLLLDESLCSLDLKLKRQMQIELKKLQKKLGITFIYVTHDQDEALTMSDRIVILNKGLIEQIDTPKNIYKKPISAFVADFIGDSNILDAEVLHVEKDTVDVEIRKEIKLTFNKDEKEYTKGEKIKILIRPENIAISENILKNSVEGIVTDNTYDGEKTKLLIKIFEDIELKVSTRDDKEYKLEDKVHLKIEPHAIVPIKGKEKNEERK